MASSRKQEDHFDVFINYHGEDVKKNFGSHLCRGLSGHGLRVCLSHQELQREDTLTSQIERIIRTTPLHIAIFSTNYAESSPCLNELLLMLKSGSTVIPVFYGVHVADLKEKGAYGLALHRHSEENDLIGKWRRALSDVAQKSGFVLDACNGNEGMLVSKIVKRVLKKLKNHLYYNVFISHRGPDVKKTFASHLYHCLRAHGLRVFLDIEELQKGDVMTSQIERAIQTATVHIAIFSENYAQSVWCLYELDLMCQSKSTILPVFHGVKPLDLQSRDGKYCKSLDELAKQEILNHKTRQMERRYHPSVIDRWEKALSNASKIPNPFDLEEYDSDEGELVFQLVQRVKRVLYEKTREAERGKR